jgi:NADPH2:quinone reductase
MKAIVIHEHGDESAMEYHDVPDPQTAPKRVVVDVRAASINRGDLGRVAGTYGGRPGPLPFTPGWEVAGTVAAIGREVQGFQLGDPVIAQMGEGGYAEKALAHQAGLTKMPQTMSFEDACSIPVVFLTAWIALHRLCRLQSGETALIQAGGSGVGIAAIQLAKVAGARVITTAGTDEKCAKCADLGADHTINYREKGFAEEVARITDGRGVDVVLESVGGEVFDKSVEAMARFGRLCTVGNSAGEPNSVDPRALMVKNLSISGFYLGGEIAAGGARPALEEILRLFAEHRLRTVIDRTFPLSDAAAAHRYVAERSNFGKVVLVP